MVDRIGEIYLQQIQALLDAPNLWCLHPLQELGPNKPHY